MQARFVMEQILHKQQTLPLISTKWDKSFERKNTCGWLSPPHHVSAVKELLCFCRQNNQTFSQWTLLLSCCWVSKPWQYQRVTFLFLGVITPYKNNGLKKL